MSSSLRASSSHILHELRCQARRQHLQRRYAHNEHHYTSGDHTASFGKSFYFVVTAIPSFYLIWALSRPNADGSPNSLTKLIDQYSDYRQLWMDRNARRTEAIEQASRDRNLFLNSSSSGYHELRYPEIFNAASPINVSAGHAANLDEVMAHYKKKANEAEEEKLRRLREEQRAALKVAAQK